MLSLKGLRRNPQGLPLRTDHFQSRSENSLTNARFFLLLVFAFCNDAAPRFVRVFHSKSRTKTARKKLYMKKPIVVLAALALSFAGSVHAQSVLADWTFQTSVPATAGPFSPELGLESSTATVIGSHAGASVYSSPAGNGSSHSFSSTLWATGDYYQIQLSTLGSTGITLSFDQVSSSTGPGQFQLQYSLDGTTFSEVGMSDYTVLANAAPNPLWNSTTSSSMYSYTYNLSSVIGAGIENQPSLYIRFTDDSTTAANGGTVGTGGTDRMDNIIVDAATTTLVPEPSTLALAGAGASMLLGLIRRKK